MIHHKNKINQNFPITIHDIYLMKKTRNVWHSFGSDADSCHDECPKYFNSPFGQTRICLNSL